MKVVSFNQLSAHVLSIVICFSGSPIDAHAEQLSQEALYYRCFQQFTQIRPDAADPRLAEVRSGQKSAVQACMEVFDLAELNAGTGRLINEMDPTARRVYSTFDRFHNSFFANNDPQSADDFAKTSVNMQPTAFGYFVSRVAFTRSLAYSAILTDSQSYEAIRTSPRTMDFFAHPTFNVAIPNGDFIVDVPNGNGGHVPTTWNPTLQDFGAPVGVRPTNPDIIPNLWPDRRPDSLPSATQYDIKQNHGGGLAGEPNYFLLNAGSSVGFKTDGGMDTYRRFSAAIFSDFLCRSLPVLRPADVANLVRPNSPHSFWRGASCVQCHASMDTMAGVVRGLTLGRSSSENLTGTEFISVHTQPVLAGGVGYAHEAPVGKVFFRNIDGNLVNIPVNGLSELGSALASTPDFYACAAKRYYNFLTGIDVPLYDPLSPEAPVFNDVDLEQIRIVKALGAELSRTQKVRDLLQRILESISYQQG